MAALAKAREHSPVGQWRARLYARRVLPRPRPPDGDNKPENRWRYTRNQAQNGHRKRRPGSDPPTPAARRLRGHRRDGGRTPTCVPVRPGA
jgi:hypothetical protein